MRGYEGETGSEPFVDGWLATGDLGYLAEGELFLTGRIKELIVALGRNYAPQDIEWAAAGVAGVRPGRCAAFTRPDGRDGDVVVVVEARPDADLEKLPAKVRTAVADAVGLTPREVFVVAKDTLP